ncbi:MAG TPA: hypothetical protein VF190_01095 [Rhodothermales bacterium]
MQKLVNKLEWADWRVLLVLLPLLIVGCQGRRAGTAAPADSVTVDRGRFGDPYRVVGNFNEADPELYPLLVGDTLTVRLTYAGGCESHAFDTDYDIRGDTAFIWFRHDARNDDCEALVHDEVQTVLPNRVVEQKVVALLHPQPGPPQILRY